MHCLYDVMGIVQDCAKLALSLSIWGLFNHSEVGRGCFFLGFVSCNKLYKIMRVDYIKL